MTTAKMIFITGGITKPNLFLIYCKLIIISSILSNNSPTPIADHRIKSPKTIFPNAGMNLPVMDLKSISAEGKKMKESKRTKIPHPGSLPQKVLIIPIAIATIPNTPLSMLPMLMSLP
jgi:hypothetical protein